MKKIVLTLLLLVGCAFADDFDMLWDFTDIPDNFNRPELSAPDFNKERSLPSKAWEGTKSVTGVVVDKTLAPAVEWTGGKVEKVIDKKVFDPWQKKNKELEGYVDEQKKHAEDNMLAVIWYYLSGGSKQKK